MLRKARLEGSRFVGLWPHPYSRKQSYLVQSAQVGHFCRREENPTADSMQVLYFHEALLGNRREAAKQDPSTTQPPSEDFSSEWNLGRWEAAETNTSTVFPL